MNKRFSRAVALAAVTVLALALTAVALAATPKDGTYGGKDLSLNVKGGKITEITGGAGYKCNAIPLDIKKSIKVSKKGKFHFKGKAKNVIGKAEGEITINGKFKTKNKAKGHFKFVKGTCKVDKDFTAKFGKSAA